MPRAVAPCRDLTPAPAIAGRAALCQDGLGGWHADTPVLRQVYNAEAAPVEQLFRDAGLLLDFEITGGIPQTLPRLLDALRPHSAHLEEKQAA